MSEVQQHGETAIARRRDPVSAAQLFGLGEEDSPAPEPLPSPEELQRSFPQYEIVELIGHGGMGAVYKARQVALDRVVAIKLLPQDLGEKPGFAARFEREALAMARLSHPNIVTVFDYGRTDEGRLFFVMEYVDGTNLSELIRSGTLDPAQALAIAGQLCDGLAYAHGEGVVHRDIKPANILVDHRLRVKVADFGLVRLTTLHTEASTLTMTGAVMGTLDYMAPEQRKGMEVDHRADIYSLGVIIYEMFCRERPQGIFIPPSKRSGCDRRIDNIVHRALQQEPARRYGTTQEMKFDVETIRSSDAGGGKRQRLRAWSVWFGSAIAVAAFVALAIVAYRSKVGSDSPTPMAVGSISRVDPQAMAERVVTELRKANPEFNPKDAWWRIEDGSVTEFGLDIVAISDLTPIQALTGLKRLRLGRPNQKGKLKSLEALRGLPLEWLECHYAEISDLTPLHGMPLRWFVCQGSQVDDLTPLRGCPLQALGINETEVDTLEPLRGMPLRFLNCGRTAVSDLEPLIETPLIDLNVSGTQVRDLTPVRTLALTRLICTGAPIEDLSPISGMLLKEVSCDIRSPQDREILRSISSLERINGVSAAEFWKTR
jgi:serine/threonine protein kinase